MAARVKGKPKKSTAKSGFDGRKRNKGRVENLKPFKSAADNGGVPDPRINLSGKPRLLGESYKEWLATINENDPQKRTNAQLGAVAIGLEMLKGDVAAAREIRAATEGDRLELTGKDGGALIIRVIYDEKQIHGNSDPSSKTA